MTWLTPFAGLILAASVIPPLLLLYFLRLRRSKVQIPSTLLWMQSFEDLRANAPFQRLRWSILLLLQLLVLALLVLAVMQPQIEGKQVMGGRHVMLIDHSGSMAAQDDEDGLTRLEKAKDLARTKIKSRYRSGMFTDDPGETMIIAFSDRAEVMTQFTDSRQKLLDSIDAINQTHGASSLGEALELARAYTTNVNPDLPDQWPVTAPPSIQVISDGRITDLDTQVVRGTDEAVSFIPVGDPGARNIAVGTLAVERPYDRLSDVEVFAGILNFITEPQDINVQLTVNGVIQSVESVSLPAAAVSDDTGVLSPGARNITFLPFNQPTDAVIEVEILSNDSLGVDNARRVVVPPPAPLSVAVVSKGQSAIKTILEGWSRLRELKTFTPESYELAAEQGQLDEFDVIVIDDYAPTNFPPGRYLTTGKAPPLDGFNEYGVAKADLMLSSTAEHPVMQFVNADRLYVAELNLIQPDQDIDVIMEGSKGPFAAVLARGEHTVVHVTFAPLDSNWPVLRSILPFTLNAIEFLAASNQSITARALQPGQAITARLPMGVTQVLLIAPDQEEWDLSIGDDRELVWGPAQQAGRWKLKYTDDQGSQERTVAVNMDTASEGDLRVRNEMKFGTDRVAIEGSVEMYRALWPWALLVCLGLLMMEWWVFHRRTI